jgi:preprotein translocase subunit YajC
MSSFDISILRDGRASDGAAAHGAAHSVRARLGIFYFIILSRCGRSSQKVQDFLRASGRRQDHHDRRPHGQVTRISGETVQLQIADKVRIEVSKAAVGGLQGQPQVQEAEGTSQAKD